MLKPLGIASTSNAYGFMALVSFYKWVIIRMTINYDELKVIQFLTLINVKTFFIVRLIIILTF